MCKTLQTSPFFILFSLTAISFKIWSVFNLLTSKIIHTHPSEKRLGGFPDRWEATPYPPSFSGPFCRGQTRLFLLCFLLSFLLPFPHSLVCRATFFPQRIPSRYTHLGWPGLTQVASTLVSLFIFFFNRFYLKNFWGFFLMWTMCYKVASVLCFVFFGHKACGILAHQPGIEPMALWKAKSFFFLIHYWLCWVFVAARGLSLVGSGGYSLLQSTCSRHKDLVAPWYVGSSQIRDQTVSPALAGRFLTTGPPGKSLPVYFGYSH